MNLAAIDIGTNSALLLICRSGQDGSLEVLHQAATITRLGQGVAATGRLHDDAMERTLTALQTYTREMDSHQDSWRGAVGTEALRRVDNATDFLDRARETIGCQVEVVTGQREAELMVKGVTGDLGRLPGRSLIVDIGGGSTELVLVEDGSMASTPPLSLPLGAVRLTERYARTDPPLEGEVEAMRGEARWELGRIPREMVQVDRLIGTAGTITTMAAVQLGLKAYDSARINGLALAYDEVARQRRLFETTPLEVRRGIPGLDPARADVILAGAVILQEIMSQTAGELTVSDRGVRWGLIREGLECFCSD